MNYLIVIWWGPEVRFEFSRRDRRAMADKIFINYRREDSIGTAGRLHDRLAETFGQQNLFMDVDGIPAGVDFVADLNIKWLRAVSFWLSSAPIGWMPRTRAARAGSTIRTIL